MRTLGFMPFDKKELISGLERTFPQYKIQSGLGTLQVRTSGFTFSGNIAVKANPRTGEVKLTSNYDMWILFLFLMPPIGIYILARKNRTLKLEQEVADGLTQILEPWTNAATYEK